MIFIFVEGGDGSRIVELGGEEKEWMERIEILFLIMNWLKIWI